MKKRKRKRNNNKKKKKIRRRRRRRTKKACAESCVGWGLECTHPSPIPAQVAVQWQSSYSQRMLVAFVIGAVEQRMHDIHIRQDTRIAAVHRIHVLCQRRGENDNLEMLREAAEEFLHAGSHHDVLWIIVVIIVEVVYIIGLVKWSVATATTATMAKKDYIAWPCVRPHGKCGQTNTMRAHNAARTHAPLARCPCGSRRRGECRS